eukprot:TRINITY_DN7010_c0_g1_i1.p2 TRINITY_DN7010_c0_g1~~TRINITY_DN7010_c0_g1_i1.p2  ORF type:complete len:166 (-),score=6.89 TRINITY_DN7010_c0_g1_i1:19-516(-)
MPENPVDESSDSDEDLLTLVALGGLQPQKKPRLPFQTPQCIRGGTTHLSPLGISDFDRKWRAVWSSPGEFRTLFRVDKATFIAIMTHLSPLITRHAARRNAEDYRARAGRRLSSREKFCAFCMYVFHRYTVRRLAIEFATSTETARRVDALNALPAGVGWAAAVK